MLTGVLPPQGPNNITTQCQDAGPRPFVLEPVLRQRDPPSVLARGGRRMASMLLTVASSVQRRFVGRQTASEPFGDSRTGLAAPQPPAALMAASSQRTHEDDGMMLLASPAAVSNGLKDLLVLQEHEQQSLWSLNAALQACIAV